MKPKCEKCQKKVDEVIIRDDIFSIGGMEITIHCHGEKESFTLDFRSFQSRFRRGGLVLDNCFSEQ